MKLQKTLMAGMLLAASSFSKVYAQLPHGPYLGLEFKGAVPTAEFFKDIHKPGLGVNLKAGMQVGDNSFITCSGEFMQFAAKEAHAATGKFKERNTMLLQTGFRYQFAEEQSTSVFFLEPQLGWMFIGTDYNTMAITPVFGYSMGGKLDVSVWLRTTTSQMKSAKLGMAGVGVAYNLFFNKRS